MKASHKQNLFQKLLWFSIYIYIYLFISIYIYAGMNPSFRAEFRRILLCKAKSSQVCEELRRPKDVELKKILARSARGTENQEEEGSTLVRDRAVNVQIEPKAKDLSKNIRYFPLLPDFLCHGRFSPIFSLAQHTSQNCDDFAL